MAARGGAGSPDALGQALSACQRCLARCGQLQIGRDVRAKLDADDLVRKPSPRAQGVPLFRGNHRRGIPALAGQDPAPHASNIGGSTGGFLPAGVARAIAGPRRPVGTPGDELETGEPSPYQTARRGNNWRSSPRCCSRSARQRQAVTLHIGEKCRSQK